MASSRLAKRSGVSPATPVAVPAAFSNGVAESAERTEDGIDRGHKQQIWVARYGRAGHAAHSPPAPETATRIFTGAGS